MELVAQVEPSGGTNTGHMVIGQETAADARHFGYRFDPDDLPDEYFPAERWRDYLFNHTVPGNIVDETEYVRLLTTTLGRVYCSKRVACAVRIEDIIPPPDRWRAVAAYSFNPDDFHSAASPCYNCVTWAVEVGNRVSPEFLTPVRQGRIKLMVEQLQSPQSPGATDSGQEDRQAGD